MAFSLFFVWFFSRICSLFWMASVQKQRGHVFTARKALCVIIMIITRIVVRSIWTRHEQHNKKNNSIYYRYIIAITDCACQEFLPRWSNQNRPTVGFQSPSGLLATEDILIHLLVEIVLGFTIQHVGGFPCFFSRNVPCFWGVGSSWGVVCCKMRWV